MTFMSTVAAVSVVLSAPDIEHRQGTPCEADPELFFPVGTSGPALLQIAEAKTICRSCRNTTSCLNWALEMGEDEGIWGGTTADERRALRLRRNRAGRVRR